MPYFGEQQQQPWGQPQQEQWGQPQQQWSQPQQQWSQPQQHQPQQQWQTSQQSYQPVPEQQYEPQQTFSTVQTDEGTGGWSPPSWVASQPAAVTPAPPAENVVPTPIPGAGVVPPGMPGVSPELQNLITGLPNVQDQIDPGMGGVDPRMQMLLMMLAGGGGQAPEQGETNGVKTRKVPDSWGSPPQVPQGEPPVSGNIPGFGMFNGPMTIANWISQSIADHGPLEGGQ